MWSSKSVAMDVDFMFSMELSEDVPMFKVEISY